MAKDEAVFVPNVTAEQTPEEQTQDGTEESLQYQLLRQTQQELAEMKDRYLRALADMANMKKRLAQERQEARERGMVSVIVELLPVLDNFERAFSALQQANDLEALLEGIKLIHYQFQEALKRKGLEPIEALGKEFDPYYHEAAGQVPSNGASEDEIVEEILRGYRIGDRIIRPSRVIVAKKQNGNGEA
jgi:molecular chaperone GrpE